MANYELALRAVVCAGAAIVAVQAFRAARHYWAAGFLLIVFLFNPAIPAVRLAGGLGLLAIVLSAVAFALLVDRAEAATAALDTIDHGSHSGQ